jgi:hypothetical protein
MFKADLEFEGRILIHKNGVLVLDKPNLVVTLGKQVAVSRLFSNSEFPGLSAIGVGAGSVTPAPGDTSLGNQIVCVAFDAGFPTRAGNVETCKTTFVPGVGNGNWTECGLFNAVSGGQLFSRTTFNSIPKAASDTLSITWLITVN